MLRLRGLMGMVGVVAGAVLLVEAVPLALAGGVGSPELTVPGDGPAVAPAAEGVSAPAGIETPASLPPGVTDVTVTPDPANSRVRWLELNSALLKQRVTSRVLLPGEYALDGPRFGTLYHLHGTRGNTSVGDMATDALGLADISAAATDPESFLVVSLDVRTPGWCNSCWWVDGRGGKGVLAESHLLAELIPTVEALFHVRRDHGGRAIYGSSMGGIGALIQAFRHPDLFAYVASVSGPASGGEHEDAVQLHQDGLYFGTYLVGQGYPDPVTNPAAYRNVDVVTLAPQVIGTGLEIVLGANDGCLPPFDPEPQPIGDSNCVSTGQADPQQAFHMANEYGIRIDNEALADRLVDVGVPFRLETAHGRHGISSLYSAHIVPDLNRVFAAPVTAPTTFGYKTTDRDASVWGYDLTVTDRPTEEFLSLLGARVDGTEFTVAGSGTVVVRTPPLTNKVRDVVVTLIRENQAAERLVVQTDATGRLSIELDLGPVHAVHQRRQVSRQGFFPFPRTKVIVSV